jgi:predicted RND superfamily exporter protein
VVDFIELMHRGFYSEDPKQLRIPDTREQVAQLLLISPDDNVNDYVDPSYQWVRVEARLKEQSTAALDKLYLRLAAYLAEHFPASQGYRAETTGRLRLWVLSTLDIIGSQTNSLTLSFLLIFGPLFLFFRSVKAGLFTIPSNIFPVALVLGFMGWANIPVGISTSMMSSIILGIVVDDTTHFIQYLRTRLAEHGDLEMGLRETLRTKGVGMSWTAAIVAMGFGVMVLSDFLPTRVFGWLTAASMFAGIIGELLVLPPLLLVVGSRLGVRFTRRADPAVDESRERTAA